MAKTTRKKRKRPENVGGRPETYEWASLLPLHHWFLPGKNARAFRFTALEASKRHGFKLSIRQCAMDGQEGVLVWRHADSKQGLFD